MQTNPTKATPPRGCQGGSKNNRNSAQLTLAFLSVITGCLLLIAGFIIPPLGQIEPSVLTAFGEVATFAGALCGIDYHYREKRK